MVFYFANYRSVTTAAQIDVGARALRPPPLPHTYAHARAARPVPWD